MSPHELVRQQQQLAELLRLAQYVCPECGLIRSDQTYFAIEYYVCCNLCGSEILEPSTQN